MTPCTCHGSPVVLRLSLPPGTAPEMVAAVAELAIRAYFERHNDFPRVATVAEKRAEAAEAWAFWRRTRRANHGVGR